MGTDVVGPVTVANRQRPQTTMTAIARLEITPVRERDMSAEIAAALEALEAYDVEYELTPIGTIVEADEPEAIFEAASAAHDAVDEDRVITALEIDDQRHREQHTADRVESVERELDG